MSEPRDVWVNREGKEVGMYGSAEQRAPSGALPGGALSERLLAEANRLDGAMGTMQTVDLLREAASRLASVPESRDTERLDWLEKRGCTDISLNRIGNRKEWFTVHDPDDDEELSRGSSLREAIDAARAASPDTRAPESNVETSRNDATS